MSNYLQKNCRLKECQYDYSWCTTKFYGVPVLDSMLIKEIDFKLFYWLSYDKICQTHFLDLGMPNPDFHMGIGSGSMRHKLH